MASLIQDLRLGVRMLGRRPGTAAIAIIALALGIGLTTTMFGVVNGVFLRGLPFPRADRLVYVGMVNTKTPGRPNQMTGADVADILAQQQSLQGLGTFAGVTVDLADTTGGPVRYDGARLSANVLRLLGIQPQMGRAFAETDSVPGAAPVMLISHQVWTIQFQSDPAIVGKVVRVNQQPTTIVGVMAPHFGFPDHANAWLPLTAASSEVRAGAPRVSVFGRLRDGVSMRQANEELAVIGGRLAAQYVENKDRSLSAIPLMRRFIADQVIILLSTMLVAVFGVLLIACVNVMNLQLARASERTREVAMRLALGASRARVLRQLLSEGLVLASSGAVLGLLIARVGIGLVNAGVAADDSPPFWIDIRLDATAVLFAAGLTAVAALASSLLPAIRLTRGTLSEAINDEGRSFTSLKVGRFSRGLVVAQMMLSCSLLLGSGLIVKSIASIDAAAPPYRTDGTIARLDLGQSARDEAAAADVYERVRARVAGTRPGLRVTYATRLPNMGAGSRAMEIEGLPAADPGHEPEAERIVVGADYFAVIGMPVLRGRALTDADRAGTEPVAVVSEDFAIGHLGGRDPLGVRLRFTSKSQAATPWTTVVGVTPRTVNVGRPGEADPTVFVPMSQVPTRDLELLVSSADASPVTASDLRQAAVEVHPAIAVYNVYTVQQWLDRQTWPTRVFGGLFTAFGAAALVLAAVGLYGVMAFSVRRRTSEIGIRMALGASQSDILRMVLRQGSTMLLIGMTLGLGTGLLLSRQLTQLLFQVAPDDPTVVIATLAVLGITGLVACLVPARRASSLSPLTALRRD